MKIAGVETNIDLELSLRPIIQELVRTQVCFPNLKLLVDRIKTVTIPDVDELSGNEAYVLVLTDGEKTIQALVKRRIYKTLYNEDVREGSYVILKIYHLAEGKKTHGEGIIKYLVIEDFYSIGEDDRYDVDSAALEEPILEETEPEQSPTERRLSGSKIRRIENSEGKQIKDGPPLPDLRSQELPEAEDTENHDAAMDVDPGPRKALATPPTSQQLREAMKRKWDTALDEIDTNDAYRLSKYRKLEETRAREARAAAEASAKAFVTRYESLPTTPLVSITRSNKRRNTHHDVLALIVSVNPEVIKRKSMPPKRDLRIMDISTIKKVALSVFFDAENFNPPPGTVVLFKNLTTHEFDGGCLNAFPKDCQGKDWFIPDPPGFENGEVAQLKDCWARLQYSEQVAEQGDSLLQMEEPLDVPEEEDIADHLPTVSGKKHLTCFYWAKNGVCRYTEDECAYAHYNTGVVANDPMSGQNIVATGNKNDDAKNMSALPPSKSLTCFFWARNRKCNRSDEECSYAHYDTGTVAKPPPGMTVFEPSDTKDTTPLTKTLTCYFWNRNGRCKRSDAECAYAHHDTGTVAYPPPGVVASIPVSNGVHTSTTSDAAVSAPTGDLSVSASANVPSIPSSASKGKSLTCFFWARNGHCIRSDTECGYAHYDTGTVANNPSQNYQPESGQVKLGAPFKPSTASTSISSRPVSAPTPNVSSTTTVPSLAAFSPSVTTATDRPKTPTTTTTDAPVLATTAAADSMAPTENSAVPEKSFPSVKHLTCYFYANYGRCKRSDAECNYAHFYTGKVADNPMKRRKG
ncbi:MAG: hypothetical protein Q9174_005945 [Haloplaca sp. 1 TL-2023]